jgi:hypothetical protein
MGPIQEPKSKASNKIGRRPPLLAHKKMSGVYPFLHETAKGAGAEHLSPMQSARRIARKTIGEGAPGVNPDLPALFVIWDQVNPATLLYVMDFSKIKPFS